MKSIFSGKIITIPNLLSLFRILLIPVFIRVYIGKGDSVAAVLLLLLSGLTDMIDGWIARRFNMVSNLGKALDPVADKLTQIAVMVCLVFQFNNIWIPLGALCIKELFTLATGLMVIQKTKEVLSSEWHGKMATVVLYAMLTAQLLFPSMPQEVSVGLILLSTGLILLSGILYGIRNIRVICSAGKAS